MNMWLRPRMRMAASGAAVLLFAGMAGAVLSRTGWAQGAKDQAKPVISDAALSQRTSTLADMENGFVAIAQRVEPSVASIRVRRTVNVGGGGGMGGFDQFFRDFSPFGQDQPQRPQMPRQFRQEGGGSGVIVRSDGWILTNDHVVNNADKVTVKLADGREFEGKVSRDYRSDIALIKVNATGLPALQFADSEQVKVGQWAMAFGSPFSLDNTMTTGIVSAKGRQEQIGGGRDARFYPSLIQTDAAVNPGNSGGPLVDIRGRVIGINVAINSPTGGSVGIGFAIPADTARRIMEQLVSKGKVVRGFLGVVPKAMTPADRERYGVRTGGALLEQVSGDTPATRAGLQVEDVVLSFDGKPVVDDVDLRERIASAAPGSKHEMKVKRGATEKTYTVTLGEAEDLNKAAEAPVASDAPGKLGIRVEPLDRENAKRYNLGDMDKGLVVVEVQSGGPADEAGIQPGTVLLKANGRPLASLQDMTDALKNTKSGDRISLVVARDKSQLLVTVTLP